jgi:hypothetical protein
MILATAPLADTLARELAATDPTRRALTREEYTQAFLRAAPHLATSPDRDVELLETIAALEARGIVRRSKRQDGRGERALPTRITLLERTSDPPVGPEVARYPWRPELAFTARLPLRRSEFDALRAIQAFLRDVPPDAPAAPIAERSLQLFGDEKRLDALQRTRLFGPGRLSLELLRTYRCAPPFVYTTTGSGHVALVIENVATYYSVIAALPPDSPIGLVVFGAGNAFVSSVAYFGELIARGKHVRAIRYFGDLDAEGLRIPIGADHVAQELGLPSVGPALRLWSELLQRGRPAMHTALTAATAAKLAGWLPPELRAEAACHLVAGTRLAQEAVSLDALRRDAAWYTSEGLGLDDGALPPSRC